jgi:hypothetical protein
MSSASTAWSNLLSSLIFEIAFATLDDEMKVMMLE